MHRRGAFEFPDEEEWVLKEVNQHKLNCPELYQGIPIKLPRYAKYEGDARKQPKWELITDMQFSHDRGFHILKTNYHGWVLIKDCKLK